MVTVGYSISYQGEGQKKERVNKLVYAVGIFNGSYDWSSVPNW